MEPPFQDQPASRDNNDEISEDDPLIIFNEEDVQEGLDSCRNRNSKVGKIITEKPIHKNSIQSALANIWCNPRGFRVEEIQGKLAIPVFPR